MIKHTIARILMIGGVASSVLFAGAVSAIDWNITGFFRQEVAYSIAGNNNELNAMGLVFNDKITPNITHAGWGTGANGAALTTAYINPTSGLQGGVFHPGFAAAGGIPAGRNTNSPVNCRFGGQNAINAGSPGLSS
ncbi:MAG: hypothetical protein VX929_06970, partial [Pseudomonadota bacterium]|nr:hypothetical protein [Pseudomonadota bacterium]